VPIFAGGAGIDEPTAAALGYGMAEQENLLVIDLGVDAGFIPVRLEASGANKSRWGLFSNGEKLLAEKSAQKVKNSPCTRKSRSKSRL